MCLRRWPYCVDSVCIHLEGVCSSSVKSGYERKTEDYWRQNFSGKVFEIVGSPTTPRLTRFSGFVEA